MGGCGRGYQEQSAQWTQSAHVCVWQRNLISHPPQAELWPLGWGGVLETKQKEGGGLSGHVGVSGSCGSRGGRGDGDEAVPRMATQKWPPGCHRRFEPGKVTGGGRATAGYVKGRGGGTCHKNREVSSSVLPVLFIWPPFFKFGGKRWVSRFNATQRLTVDMLKKNKVHYNFLFVSDVGSVARQRQSRRDMLATAITESPRRSSPS